GNGTDSGGGDVTIGDVTEDFPSSVSITGTVNASGASAGGIIEVNAIGDVQIPGKLLAEGQFGGLNANASCSITIPAGGAVSGEPGGVNQLVAGSLIKVQGMLHAGDGGTNELRYLSQVPSVTPAGVAPAASLIHDTSIPCCVACPPPTTSTTTTSIPTTS